MAIVVEIDEQVLAAKFGAILPHLDERQRRLFHYDWRCELVEDAEQRRCHVVGGSAV